MPLADAGICRNTEPCPHNTIIRLTLAKGRLEKPYAVQEPTQRSELQLPLVQSGRLQGKSVTSIITTSDRTRIGLAGCQKPNGYTTLRLPGLIEAAKLDQKKVL